MLLTNPTRGDAEPGCVVDAAWHGSTLVVRCSGVIDMVTAPLVQDALTAALAQEPSAVVVDLGAVEFLAAAGMGVLIATHTQLTPEVRFAVVADGPITSRPLRLTGVADHVNMHATLDAALASFEPPPDLPTETPHRDAAVISLPSSKGL